MSFKVIDEKFVCGNCGTTNDPLKFSCRNHCSKCLYSLHVDKESPGDRESTCKSLMSPFRVYQDGKKGWMIEHKCEKCGKIIPNKAAPNDNFDLIIQLTQDEPARSQKT